MLCFLSQSELRCTFAVDQSDARPMPATVDPEAGYSWARAGGRGAQGSARLACSGRAWAPSGAVVWVPGWPLVMPSRVEDYEVLHSIGTGSYGRCQKIRRKSDGKVRRRGGAGRPPERSSRTGLWPPKKGRVRGAGCRGWAPVEARARRAERRAHVTCLAAAPGAVSDSGSGDGAAHILAKSSH